MSDFNFYSGDPRTHRLIAQVKMGLRPIENDEAILQFLHSQPRGLTVPQYVGAYRQRHAAMVRPFTYNPGASGVAMPRPSVPPYDLDPPAYNPGASGAIFRQPPGYNLGAGGVAMSRQPPPYDASRANGMGAIVAASAPPPDDDDDNDPDIQRAMRESAREFNIQQKLLQDERQQIDEALALSRREGEDVNGFLRRVVSSGQLPKSPMASADARAQAEADARAQAEAEAARVIEARQVAATACNASPLWLALTKEQRRPFYLPGTVRVNVKPVVEFPNPIPTAKNPGPTISVPNRAMRSWLDLLFPADRLQSDFDDACPVMADVDLLKNGGYNVKDLFRDSITQELFDNPQIAPDGVTYSQSTLQVPGYFPTGVPPTQPNEAFNAFLESLGFTPDEKESFGGKSRNMQKNRRKSQNRKRSQSRKRSQNKRNK